MAAFRDIFTATPPDARTENGALTYSSSHSACVDFFGNICRPKEFNDSFITDVEKKIYKLLPQMWSENPLYCLKLIFYKRDCRGGAGEKKIFEICYIWLLDNHFKTAIHNLDHVPFYGSYKDLVKFYNFDHLMRWDSSILKTEIIKIFKDQLQKDELGMIAHGPISLAAKWAPSTGSKQYKRLAQDISNSIFNKKSWERPYRKLLSDLREYLNVTERLMCSKQWENIDFSKVPSLCMHKNKKHFQKHCPKKFSEWVSKLKTGQAKVNASQLLPNQLVNEIIESEEIINKEDEDLIQQQWSAIVQRTKSMLGSKKILVVTDLSGSMDGLPMTVSISMGCLLSEVSEGPFKDLIITFSESPSFFKLEGQNLREKVKSLRCSDSMGFNTDLIKVFKILLKKCTMNNIKQEDLPEIILICTDNEFDCQIKGDTSETTYQHIKSKFVNKGYKIPIVVFWNLRSNANSIPVTKDEINTILISGFSPSVLKCILCGEIPSPYAAMCHAINDSRYDRLKMVVDD